MRKETDSLGEIEIEKYNLWGSFTQRSLKHFVIGEEKVPLGVIYSVAMLKRASAIANYKLKLLSKEKKDLIVIISEEIINKKHDEHFPLSMWHGGSGTPINMNVNEVIANIASRKTKKPIGSKKPLHPIDDINMGQSTNDIIPSAINISTYLLLKKKLLPSLEALKSGFEKKIEEFKDIIKVGRTHLMDAIPITLGQEFSAFASSLDEAIESIKKATKRLTYIPLGGTAVGTGLNAHKEFSKIAIDEISKILKEQFHLSKNMFHDIAFVDSLVSVSSSLKQLSVTYMKIATDLSLLASGPRCSIAELILPSNEPGSSIMPGKVNPTQLEILKMVSMQVIGNDTSISIAASSGNFQINVFKAVIIHNIIQSINLLSDVSKSFLKYCLKGIKANKKNIEENLNKNLMLATMLNRKIGYDKASQIVKKAHLENLTLKEAALELGIIDEKDFNEIINFKKMVRPHG